MEGHNRRNGINRLLAKGPHEGLFVVKTIKNAETIWPPQEKRDISFLKLEIGRIIKI
jgi:hypothetical protein